MMGAEWEDSVCCFGIEEKFKQSELEGGEEDARTMFMIDRLGAFLVFITHSAFPSALFPLQRLFSDKNIHKPIPIPQQCRCARLFVRGGLHAEEILSLKNYSVNFTLEMERLAGAGEGGT